MLCERATNNINNYTCNTEKTATQLHYINAKHLNLTDV